MDSSSREQLKQSLVSSFFRGDQAFLDTPAGAADLRTHLDERENKFRRIYTPWLRAIGLAGRFQTLDIGCGTGCSSVILAELGHFVTAMDGDERSLAVARVRLALGDHKDVGFQVGTCPSNLAALSIETQDLIVFWASIEHFTIDERLASLRECWGRMKRGAALAIFEAPNRLWYHDDHTTNSPFYHWLPDALARAQRGSGGGTIEAASDIDLYRAGRGVSFHEFALAGIPVGNDARISSLQLWNRRNPLKALRWFLRDGHAHERLLARHATGIHRGFCQPNLDLVMRKV